MRFVYDNYKYITEPHTAVAWSVSNIYNNSSNIFVTISTASPIKFHENIYKTSHLC